MKTKFVIASFALVSLVLGCELIVDFDRTKIPQPVTDAGGGQDVVQPPPADAGPDVGRDASGSDASDGSSGDGSSDAESDAEPDTGI